MADALTAVGPLDGRYAEKVAALRDHLSEYALIRERACIEIDWLLWLAGRRRVPCKSLSERQRRGLEKMRNEFGLAEAKRVKRIEKTTRHDVKAVEMFLAEALQKRGMKAWVPWLHFGCTSEDINNIAHARMVTGALRGPLRDTWRENVKTLRALARRTAKMPMLARTHGQPASPTTMGKELNVFVHRLEAIAASLDASRMTVKMGGATGNLSAWQSAVPSADWVAITQGFLKRVAPGCEPLEVTTQIDPHDALAKICLELTRLGTAMIDLCRDMWQYIGMGYFAQRKAKGQVGSSTMPHKVNPIDFENAEGNFGVAIALLTHLATKLPISRLQRDLTDSTVIRSLGEAFGHFLLALRSLQQGLDKVDPVPAQMRADLSGHWEVLAEPIQTVLRAHGVADAYEQLRKATQGKVLDQKTHRAMVEALPIPDEDKARLAKLRPETYVGIAADLARR